MAKHQQTFIARWHGITVSSNERQQALHLLVSLVQDKVSLQHLIQTQPNLTPFTKELCFGVCRHYYRLEALAERLVKKRPKPIEIWITLLLGLYQLHYLQMPDYAVVKECVSLVNKMKQPWAKGLINAVLRTYCREKEKLIEQLQQHSGFLYGHPDWLLKQLQTHWPDHWQAIVAANDVHPPMTLRVNGQKSTTQTYQNKLAQQQINAHQHPFAKQAIILDKPCKVDELPGFAQGEVSVQDAAAQLTTTLLDLKPNLRVLDACCAPGGKTCHILETEPNLQECIALDVDEKRLQRVRQNIERLQLNVTLLQGDALQPQTWWDGVLFDRILLDAPCSATGVIRRHSDIKLLRSLQDIHNIIKTQHDLLIALWPLLKTGGTLVYATCSIMPEENEHQIARFISNHPDCECITKNSAWGHPTGNGLQILPGEHDMDGFFYSALRKRSP